MFSFVYLLPHHGLVMVLVGNNKLMANEKRKDEFGTAFPRFRRTLSAANFSGASRRAYTALNNDDTGNIWFLCSTNTRSVLFLD